MNEINPPAMIRQATSELEQLAFEANRFHEMGESHARQSLEHFKRAGDALLKAKAQCGHGKWLEWLKKNVKFSGSQARRYMRVAANSGKLVFETNLAEALRFLTEPVEDEEDEAKTAVDEEPFELPTPKTWQAGQDEEPFDITPAPKPVSALQPALYCRNCRIHGPKRNCKECMALRTRDQQPQTESHGRHVPAHTKNGQVMVDWRNLDAQWGSVVRWPEAVVKAYPAEKGSVEYQATRRMIDELAELRKQWHSRISKGGK